MEETNRLERESGGYTRRLYPAEGDGPPPLETDDDLI